ncbi:MAG TPA: MoaD/ThiS family protein [Pyrinomonadaceae bacterium]|jgi:molybdopterin converting factor small subunit|nr:MoaD/ThiS family protein [Pyrinomonadaceae bacterium]
MVPMTDIKVSVLFFGVTAEIVGKREIEMSLEPPVKSAAVFRQVTDRYPTLNDHRLLFAFNQEYSTGNEIVCDGDELAIFSAVSGG